MINVAIVEDDNIYREGISKYISAQSSLFCKFTADNINSFMTNIEKYLPIDVVLVDIGLPGISGINGAKLIKEKFPDFQIIMLTVYSDTKRIFESMRNGAVGYLLKDTPLNEIKNAIKIVSNGGAQMSPEIARKVIEFYNGKNKINNDYKLTNKEVEVVKLLVDGISYKMIADELNISLDTVRFHIKNIYKKLHINNKADLMKKSFDGEL